MWSTMLKTMSCAFIFGEHKNILNNLKILNQTKSQKLKKILDFKYEKGYYMDKSGEK